jgi:nucleotide-binding universal stress UspA family protein
MQVSPINDVLSMLPRPDQLRINKILVSLDFDDQALRVLEASLCIARYFHSEVFLVHSVSPYSSSPVTNKETACLQESSIQSGIKRLKDAVAARPSLNSVTHHEIAAAESPFNLIQQIVASERIDLIIVGSHGASGLERIASGSFAEGLMRRASCPTLIVGPHAVVSGNPFRRILLATDLGEGCASATDFAAAVATRFQGELYALHVIKRKNSAMLAPSDEADELFSRHRMRTSLPQNITSSCTLGLLVKHGAPQKAVVETAAEYNAGVIITGISEGMLHDDHAPWSTFAAIVKEAHCPVLAIPHKVPIDILMPPQVNAVLVHSHL